MRRLAPPILSAALTMALWACGPPAEQTAPGASADSGEPAAVATPLPTDGWIGQWPGVEGTYLTIEAGTPGAYKLTIADLDGPKVYTGAANGATITFERNGVTETIKAGDGKATGMKWLTEKSDCLVIKSGEGFCR
jgi:ABC-type Fe3+-hydroxamate transport system substrate-binding protein